MELHTTHSPFLLLLFFVISFLPFYLFFRYSSVFFNSRSPLILCCISSLQIREPSRRILSIIIIFYYELSMSTIIFYY